MTEPKNDSSLTDYDRDILRMLNGEKVEGMAWGAAMGECIWFLRSHRLVEQHRTGAGIEYRITDAGRAAIASDSPVQP